MMPFADPRPLRVALADDHAVVRAGYRRLLELETDIVVVAEYGNADAAYDALCGAAGAGTDLLVLDLSMPGRSGPDLLQRLARRRPEIRILVFTMHDSAAMLAQCMRAGAVGFITKSSAPEVLVEGVRRAARGERVVSPDVASRVGPGDLPDAPHTRLSSREFDILQHLLAGRSIEDIARTLRLSAKTVANCQTRIRRIRGAERRLGWWPTLASSDGRVAASRTILVRVRLDHHLAPQQKLELPRLRAGDRQVLERAASRSARCGGKGCVPPPRRATRGYASANPG